MTTEPVSDATPARSPRPRILTVLTALLVILALLSAASPLMNSLMRPNFGNNRPGAGGNNPDGGEFQNRPNGGNNQNGGFQGRGGNGGFRLFGGNQANRLNFQLIGYIFTGISVLGIGLLLLSAFGSWTQKRWSLNLALTMGILFLLATLPGLFGGIRVFNPLAILRFALTIASAGLAAAIAVICILPSTRETVE